MNLTEIVTNVAEGITSGEMGETTAHSGKNTRSLHARIPSLAIFASGRTTIVYKPYARVSSKNKMKKPFFIYCTDMFKSRTYVDYNDFASHADEAEKILMKYYHVDEQMFAIVEKNPYIIFPVTIDWHKVAEEFGDDFTGVSPINGMRRSDIVRGLRENYEMERISG